MDTYIHTLILAAYDSHPIITSIYLIVLGCVVLALLLSSLIGLAMPFYAAIPTIVLLVILGIIYPKISLMNNMTVQQKYANDIYNVLYEIETKNIDEDTILDEYVYVKNFPYIKKQYSERYQNLQSAVFNNKLEPEHFAGVMLPLVTECMKQSQLKKADKRIRVLQAQIQYAKDSCIQTSVTNLLQPENLKKLR